MAPPSHSAPLPGASPDDADRQGPSADGRPSGDLAADGRVPALPGRRARHRSLPRSRRTVLLGLGVVAAAAAGATAVLTGGGAVAADCPDGRTPLRLLAAADIAPVLAAATVSGPGSVLAGDGQCLDVAVLPRPPADVAAALRAGAPLDADAWVPDSSLWLRDLDGPGSQGAAVAGHEVTPVAASPVVLAVDPATAQSAGWPAQSLEVRDALDAARLGLADPARSAASQVGLLAVSDVLGTGTEARTAAAGTFRTADRTLPDDGAAALGGVSAPRSLAVPVSEQAVWAAAARAGEPVAVAAYPSPALVLDYPLLTLTGDAARAAGLTSLRAALQGEAWSQRVQEAGFRTARGVAGAQLTAAHGVDGRVAAPAAAPDGEAVAKAVQAFDVLARGIRMLAVLDVSGSMALPVPGTDSTRMDVAIAAAGTGLSVLEDDAHVGLWTFATRLDGDQDHRELTAIGSLGVREEGAPGRLLLARALSSVQYLPQGDTGLYDTVLAAVGSVRERWDAARVNSVVIITDGRNDDDNGITLEELLDQLRRSAGERPVPVIAIGYGPDSDVDALREISRATGGATYTAPDPRELHEVVQDALGRRTCRPQC